MQTKRANESYPRLMLMRKLYITPTLNVVSMGMDEETNVIIRKEFDQAQCFIRILFVNEERQKDFYSTDTNTLLLCYMKHLIENGVRIGSPQFIYF